LPPSGPDLARAWQVAGLQVRFHTDFWPAFQETSNIHLLRFPQHAYCCCTDHVNTHTTKNTTRWPGQALVM